MERWKQMRPNYGRHIQSSFSRFGEDRILFKLLLRKFINGETGFYVDIGCAEPFLNSNTALFHLSGWNGIVVDPIAENIDAFRAQRPGDIALRTLVSNRTAPVRFATREDSPELSRIVHDTEATDGHVVELTPVTLAALLEENLPAPDTVIDILDVDAEDHDLEVLMSNDWTRFRPRVVVVEDRDLELGQPAASETYRFLTSEGYVLHSSSFISRIYTAGDFAR